MDGPATVVPQGQAFHVLLAGSQGVAYRCPAGSGAPTLTDNGRFAPTATRVAATETAFRNAFRRSIFVGAETVPADSIVTITEFYGNVAVPRQVSGADLRRAADQEYERALGWDRQYAGVVDARGDSLFVVNVVNPVLEARAVLADQWVVAAPAASAYVQTVAYRVETGAAFQLCGGSSR